MSKSELNELIDQFEQVWFSEQTTEADWQNTFSKLKQYLEHNPLDAYAHYILGYGYSVKGNNKQYPEIEKYLVRSLELEPKQAFPLFYLGMYYFNNGLYGKSLSVLDEIDFSFFTSIKQYYRISEVMEVILCDRLYLDPTKVEVSEVANVAQELVRLSEVEADHMDEEDISVHAVTPYGLARCVDALFQKKGMEKKAEEMFDIVINLIIKLGREKYVARVVDRVRIRLETSPTRSGSSFESC